MDHQLVLVCDTVTHKDIRLSNIKQSFFDCATFVGEFLTVNGIELHLFMGIHPTLTIYFALLTYQQQEQFLMSLTITRNLAKI